MKESHVKLVRYQLGPNFFDVPVMKTNPKDGFRLDVSAWGPFLCLATVEFDDGSSPLDLSRYVDF